MFASAATAVMDTALSEGLLYFNLAPAVHLVSHNRTPAIITLNPRGTELVLSVSGPHLVTHSYLVTDADVMVTHILFISGN